MKRKGLSVLLSALLVLILTVSFSVPVEAANKTVTIGSGSTTVSSTGPMISADAQHVITPVVSSSTSSSTLWINSSYNTTGYSSVDYSVIYTIPIGTINGGYFYLSGDYKYVRFTLPFSLSTTYSIIGDGIGYCQLQSAYMTLWGQERPISVPSSGASISSADRYVWFENYQGGVDLNDGMLSVRFDFLATLRCDATTSGTIISGSNTASVFPKHDFTYGNSAYTLSLYCVEDVDGIALQQITENTAATIRAVNNTTNAVNSNTSAVNTQTNTIISQTQNQTTSINNNITQQTQQQTNTLTSGYDSSATNSDNQRLNTAMTDYDDAQADATAQSVSYIDSADFVTLGGNASVLASISFASGFLQSLYTNLGDFSLVIGVCLALALALMLVGWYKYKKGG